MYRTFLTSMAMLVAAPAFAGGIAPPAFAGGIAPEPAPAPVPVIVPVAATADWTGAYAGIQYDFMDGDANFGGPFDGDVYGLFGGYRHDFGTFVLGGEIDYMRGEITTQLGGLAVDLESLVRVGVQAGYDAGPALIYGTAGVAMMEVSSVGGTVDGNGVFYGIGVDYSLSSQVTLGAEILRHGFSDFNDVPNNDVEFTTVGINVAYRF